MHRGVVNLAYATARRACLVHLANSIELWPVFMIDDGIGCLGGEYLVTLMLSNGIEAQVYRMQQWLDNPLNEVSDNGNAEVHQAHDRQGLNQQNAISKQIRG